MNGSGPSIDLVVTSPRENQLQIVRVTNNLLSRQKFVNYRVTDIR